MPSSLQMFSLHLSLALSTSRGGVPPPQPTLQLDREGKGIYHNAAYENGRQPKAFLDPTRD